jgi:hypothetical protein
MRFVAYVDRKPTTTFPPPDHVPGELTEIEVDPDIRFEDAARQAIAAAGLDPVGYFYWPHLLRDPDEVNPEYVKFPDVGVTDDGQFLWLWGARDRVTLADLERARQLGFIVGDPFGVWLEIPTSGDGVLWGWDDFIKWLLELAAVGGVKVLVGALRKFYKRWEDRGATTPYAFLDVVLAREEWFGPDLARLLGLNKQEVTDLLTSMGFEEDSARPDRWTPTADPEGSGVRKKIIEDFLHHREHEHEVDDEQEADGDDADS